MGIIYVRHSSNMDDIKVWMKPITEEVDVACMAKIRQTKIRETVFRLLVYIQLNEPRVWKSSSYF